MSLIQCRYTVSKVVSLLWGVLQESTLDKPSYSNHKFSLSNLVYSIRVLHARLSVDLGEHHKGSHSWITDTGTSPMTVCHFKIWKSSNNLIDNVRRKKSASTSNLLRMTNARNWTQFIHVITVVKCTPSLVPHKTAIPTPGLLQAANSRCMLDKYLTNSKMQIVFS